jgi:hypothetical protein
MRPPADPWGDPEWTPRHSPRHSAEPGSRPEPDPAHPPPAGRPPTGKHAEDPQTLADTKFSAPATPMYGRASVPSGPLREPTAEMESVPAPAGRPSRPVSWQRTGSASRRSLGDGWGLTATGLLVAFCGWGIWAAAGRGSIASPLTGLVFMLAVAAGVFALSRLLGYLVLTQMLHRRRLHARWSHLFTGLFLTVGGISYLSNTRWVSGADEWIQSAWDWIRAQLERI